MYLLYILYMLQEEITQYVCKQLNGNNFITCKQTKKKMNSVYVVTEVWNKWKYNLIRKQLIVLEKKKKLL